MYSFIVEYYKLGLYTQADLDIFVSAKMITEAEKQQIVSSAL